MCLLLLVASLLVLFDSRPEPFSDLGLDVDGCETLYQR